MQTKKERLTKLYNDTGLTAEDIFKSPQGWTIITRSGIDRIQAEKNIVIKYKTEVIQPGFVVVKAQATMGDEYLETYGEADMGGEGRKGNCRQTYPVAMAEKRAMSRAVLKLSGFYAEGVMGEDEADDFGKEAAAHKKTLQTATL